MCPNGDRELARLPFAEKGRREEQLNSRWPGMNSCWFAMWEHLASTEEAPKRAWSKKLPLVAPSQVGKPAWTCCSHPVGWWPTAAHPTGAARICSVPGMKGLQCRCRVQGHVQVLGDLPLRATMEIESWCDLHLQSTGRVVSFDLEVIFSVETFKQDKMGEESANLSMTEPSYLAANSCVCRWGREYVFIDQIHEDMSEFQALHKHTVKW